MAILFCLIACGAGKETPQDPATTFKTGVTQVRVDILVTNEKGSIPNLKREDFVIEEDGQPVSINSFGRDAESLSILLLLDVSGSMKDFIAQIGRRALSLLGQLRPADKVAIMGFSKESDYLMPFTSNIDRAANAIDQALRPGLFPAGTSINAALVDAAQAFIDSPDQIGHRAIFILTDNKALNYRVADEAVLRKLFAAETLLNAIVTRNAEPPKPLKTNQQQNPDFSWADVFKLSKESGGEVLRTDRADEAFLKLLSNLRERYLLTYNAPSAAPRQYHQIRVSLSKEAQKRFGKVVIRARSGYYTGA